MDINNGDVDPLDKIRPEVLLDAQNEALLGDLHKNLQNWVESVYGSALLSHNNSPDAWSARQLEFQAEVLTHSPEDGRPMALEVFPGAGGELDWYSFDQKISPHPDGSLTPQTFQKDLYPAHVMFNGMPNKRWWQFENRQVNLGSIFIDKSEVDKIAFTSFLTKYSNDWFVVPFTQKAGTLCQVEHLIVHDVFGGKTLVERTDQDERDPWTMFTNAIATEDGRTANYFFLPPAGAAFVNKSDPLEKVYFVRDEMANMVWGIEHTTENGLGQPWAGYERAIRGKKDQIPENFIAPLQYLLSTNVPENWIPFLPVHIDEQREQVVLKKGAMIGDVYDGRQDRLKITAVGKILNPHLPRSKAYRLREEEVPREGVSVSRLVRRCRWIDGSIHLWIGRNVRTGKGEARSGLKFDVARNVPFDPSERQFTSPPVAGLLDNFKRPVNSQEHSADDPWATPAGNPPLSYPVQTNMENGPVWKYWIDYHDDISCNLQTASGNPLNIHRRSIFVCRPPQNVFGSPTAALDYINCSGNGCDLYIRGDRGLNLVRLDLGYSLAPGEYFDLRGFKGTRLKVKQNTNYLYLMVSLHDSNGLRWVNSPSLELPSSSLPQDAEVSFQNMITSENNEYDIADSLGQIRRIVLLIQGKTGGNDSIFDRVEFY